MPGDSELRDVVVKARSTAGFISPPSNKIRKVITEASSRAQQLEDEIRRCSQNSHRFVDGCFGKKDGNIQRFERGDYVRRLKKELRTIRKKAKREAKKKARRDKHDAERQKHHEAKTGAGGEGEGEEGDTFDVGAAMLRNPIYEVDEDLSPAGAHSGVGPTGGDDGFAEEVGARHTGRPIAHLTLQVGDRLTLRYDGDGAVVVVDAMRDAPSPPEQAFPNSCGVHSTHARILATGGPKPPARDENAHEDY